MIKIMKCNTQFPAKVGDPVKLGRCPIGDWSGKNVEYILGIIDEIPESEEYVAIQVGLTDQVIRFIRDKVEPIFYSSFRGVEHSDGMYYGIDQETNISWTIA